MLRAFLMVEAWKSCSSLINLRIFQKRYGVSVWLWGLDEQVTDCKIWKHLVQIEITGGFFCLSFWFGLGFVFFTSCSLPQVLLLLDCHYCLLWDTFLGLAGWLLQVRNLNKRTRAAFNSARSLPAWTHTSWSFLIVIPYSWTWEKVRKQPQIY